MGFDLGFNFRATSTFVTDGANETYVLGDAYPTTRGGATFGWNAGVAARDRNAANDRRLAGINFTAGNAGSTFRIDLPSSGSVDVHVAIGDAGSAQNNQKWQIKDNTTQLTTHGPIAGVSAQHFLDENANDWTNTTWPTSETSETLTFSTTTFFFVPNSGTADNQVPAHIRVFQSSGGTTFTQSLSGSISPSGSLLKQTNKLLTAAGISPSGSLTRVAIFLESLTAGLSFSGSIIKTTMKNLVASLSFAGAETRQTNKVLTAAGISPSGSLTSSFTWKQTLTAASLSFNGALSGTFIAATTAVTWLGTTLSSLRRRGE